MVKLAIVAFIASCILAALAALAPARRSHPGVPTRSTIDFGSHPPEATATVRRVRT